MFLFVSSDVHINKLLFFCFCNNHAANGQLEKVVPRQHFVDFLSEYLMKCVLEN